MAINKKLLQLLVLLSSIGLLSCSDNKSNKNVVVDDAVDDDKPIEYIKWYPETVSQLSFTVDTSSLDGQWLIIQNSRKLWDGDCNSGPSSDRCTGYSEAIELSIVNISTDGDTVSVQGCYENNFSQHTYNNGFLEIIRSDNSFYSALIGDTSIVDNDFSIRVTNNRYMQASFYSTLNSDPYTDPLQGFARSTTDLEAYKLADIPLTNVGTITIGGLTWSIPPLCLQIDEGETRLTVDDYAGSIEEYSPTFQTIAIGGAHDFYARHFKNVNGNGQMIISNLNQSASGGANFAAYYNDIFNEGGEDVVTKGSATVALSHLLLNGIFDGSFSITDEISNDTINGTYAIDLSVYRP